MAYGDEFSQRDYDESGMSPARPRVNRANVKSRLLPPAIILLLTAIFGLGITLVNLLTQPPIDEQLATVRAQIDADPNMPPADKIQFKEWIDNMGEVLEKIQPVLIGTTMIGNMFILIGAVNMINLSSRGLAMLGAVLAMIPVVSGCCCLGVPVGIWALIILGDSEVKAAYAGSSSSSERV